MVRNNNQSDSNQMIMYTETDLKLDLKYLDEEIYKALLKIIQEEINI